MYYRTYAQAQYAKETFDIDYIIVNGGYQVAEVTPQVRDLCEYYDKKLGSLIAYHWSDGVKWKDINGQLQDLPEGSEFIRVLVRNNTPFLMPLKTL
jgi:hypothetical protein